MNELFEKVLQFSLSFEGGYSNHPRDRGGETWKGISRKAHPDWPGWSYIDKRRTPPDDLVKQLYYERFWKPLRCMYLSPAIALLLFDTAVGTGNTPAVRLLQRTLGVREDGVVGKETIDAAKKWDLSRACSFFTMYRIRYYKEIVENDKSQDVFFNGWVRRAVEARVEAERMILSCAQ